MTGYELALLWSMAVFRVMTSTLLCSAQPSDRCRCHFPAQAAGSLDTSLSNSGSGVDRGSDRWHSGYVRVLPSPAPRRVGGVALHAAVPSGFLSNWRSALLPPAKGGVAVDTCLVQGRRDAFMVPAPTAGPALATKALDAESVHSRSRALQLARQAHPWGWRSNHADGRSRKGPHRRASSSTARTERPRWFSSRAFPGGWRVS